MKKYLFSITILIGTFTINLCQAEELQEGLVACHGNEVPTDKMHTVRGAKKNLELFKKSKKYNKHLILGRSMGLKDTALALKVFGSFSWVFLDKNLKIRNGIVMGDSAEKAMGLTPEHIRGCEIVLPMKVCPNPHNPLFSIPCSSDDLTTS